MIRRANELAPRGSDLNTGLRNLLLQLTDALADGSIEPPPPPRPPYVLPKDTRPRDEVLADAMQASLELMFWTVEKYAAKARAGARARLGEVPDPRVRELALRALDLAAPH